MYLDNINGPADVKNLREEQLPVLCDEVRFAIMNRTSQCGGHLGPNLGAVELTVALHYVFSSPEDKMVFDVSHQTYSHKILTGRRRAFLENDLFGSITGYTEPRESPHDLFTIGHTSTSVSMACGLAKARDLAGRKENVIAVIGDGALSGGEAFEGLSCAAKLGSNFIVVVNDNEQSISSVRGGLYDHLKELRASKGTSANNMFKAFGYTYYYVEDGNNVASVVRAMRSVKDTECPAVVHVHTIKGKGYSKAEKCRENWHWSPPFVLETGENRHMMSGENYDDLVAEFLLDKMAKDPSVVAMAAGVPLTIGFTEKRRKAAGRQFVDVDIAEQHMLSMAAGIAKNGGKPVVATFSTFFQRAYDQLAQDICINNLPVTLIVRNGSVWAGNDVTHCGWFDLALFSNIPNLVFLNPTNCEEYFAMLDWSMEQRSHPVAIRVPRNGVHHISGPVSADYGDINKFLQTRKGERIAVLALGDFYQLGEQLISEIKVCLGVEATLVNPRYATGLDIRLLHDLEKDHVAVVTMEDGIVDGGFGQKVAAFYGPSTMRVLNYGLKKEFVDGYVAKEILQQCRISCDLIIEDLRNSFSTNKNMPR